MTMSKEQFEAKFDSLSDDGRDDVLGQIAWKLHDVVMDIHPDVAVDRVRIAVIVYDDRGNGRVVGNPDHSEGFVKFLKGFLVKVRAMSELLQGRGRGQS